MSLLLRLTGSEKAPIIRREGHDAHRRIGAQLAANTSNPAVVVGASGACGLGVVRSLSHAGIPIIVVDTNTAAPAMHSRYARGVAVSALSGRALITDLLALRTTLDQPPLLFPTSDEAALTISEFRTELDGHYRFRLPSHERLVSLMHKCSFYQLAEMHGFPVPRSIKIQTIGDLAVLAGMAFPCIIKPAVRSADYTRLRFKRGYKVASIEEAEAVCRRILPILPDLVIQEWIDGDASQIYFCLQYRGQDRTVCSFTGRKLAIWPPDVGMTASCTAAPEAHATLHDLTEKFFQAASFVGMGSMEFKRDARTGRFLMIEPTVGRVDWQEEVATIHGTNIPLAAYLHETGGGALPSLQNPPAIWRDRGMYLKSALRNLSKPRAPRTMKVYDAYWRRDDPMPAIVHARGSVKRLFRRA